MKMRDKKKKKVNRIVKAGLALLCAGALLGGAVFGGAVFGGGSVRVMAEGEYGSDQGSIDASDNVKGKYYHDTTYLVYKDNPGYKLDISSGDGESNYKITYVDLPKKISIVWDKKDDGIDNQRDAIERFKDKCITNNSSIEIIGCKLPWQSQERAFMDIDEMLKKENISQSNAMESEHDQLNETIEIMTSSGSGAGVIDTSNCNIVMLLTDDNSIGLTELEKQAVVYQLNISDWVNYSKENGSWVDDLADEISDLKCVKVTTEDGQGVDLTETALTYNWIVDDETDMYKVDSKIDEDKAVITISSESGDPIDISESDVKAQIGERELNIKKANDTGESVDNSVKFYIEGEFKKATEQDGSDNHVKIIINNEDKEYDTGLEEINAGSPYTIVENKTKCEDDAAYIYIKSDDGSDPEKVVAIVDQDIPLEKDPDYIDDSGENITEWKLIGSYDIVSEDSEDGIQIEVDGDSIGTANLKTKNDDGTVCIEHITSTDDESYVFFSSKNDANGYYMPDRNSSLYKGKLGLEDWDAEPGEDDITYNVVWDLGADSYSNGTYDFDKLSSEVEELSNNVGKNKVNIIDCNGDKIDLSGDDTQKLEPDGDRKLTKEKLEKILSDSGSPKDAYIVLTDVDGTTEVKDTISKDTDKLVYWINIGDPEKASIEKAIIPTAITDDEENGISKWDNAKNLIKSSVVFKFAGVQLTTDENGDSTTPVSITVDSVQITNVNIYEVDDNKNIIDKIWSKLRLWQKILIIAGAAVVVVLIVIMIIVSTRRKKARKRRKAAGGIPHGSPSSSPDVQLRSGVSPTAQTNVLARRAGEQNMQGMQNTVPANNTKQIQIQIIGRNPKIINTYINGSIFVGRANTCDVFINDATISRQHFALECVNGEVFIQPLVATNGTKLNGQRINDKHSLYPNDRIQIGTVGIIVRW